MGRKRATAKKSTSSSAKSGARTRAKNKIKKTVMQDFLGGTLVALGIIVFILMTFSGMSGIIKSLRTIIYGIFGVAMYILPLSLGIIGIYLIISEKHVKVSKQFYKAIFLMVMFSILVGAYTLKQYNIFDNFIRFCVDNCYWNTINELEYCGLVGGLSLIHISEPTRPY